MYFEHDMAKSDFYQESMSHNITGRYGYYEKALDNLGKRSIFGFGSKDNHVFYYAMFKLTYSRERATGESGGIHNGFL